MHFQRVPKNSRLVQDLFRQDQCSTGINRPRKVAVGNWQEELDAERIGRPLNNGRSQSIPNGRAGVELLVEVVTGRTAADHCRDQRGTYERFLWQHSSDRSGLSDFIQGRPQKVGVDVVVSQVVVRSHHFEKSRLLLRSREFLNDEDTEGRIAMMKTTESWHG